MPPLEAEELLRCAGLLHALLLLPAGAVSLVVPRTPPQVKAPASLREPQPPSSAAAEELLHLRPLPSLWQVSVQFVTTAFDPYAAPAPTSSGITRLRFTRPNDAGGSAEVSVQSLSVPIQFSLPGPPAGAEAGQQKQQAVCSFWDASRGVFRREPVAVAVPRAC